MRFSEGELVLSVSMSVYEWTRDAVALGVCVGVSGFELGKQPVCGLEKFSCWKLAEVFSVSLCFYFSSDDGGLISKSRGTECCDAKVLFSWNLVVLSSSGLVH